MEIFRAVRDSDSFYLDLLDDLVAFIMGDEQSVMMASSVGTLPSMAMQQNSSIDPFKAYAVELRKKHSANLQEIVESSLKRYDSDEVDAFVEGIINEVSSCMFVCTSYNSTQSTTSPP